MHFPVFSPCRWSADEGSKAPRGVSGKKGQQSISASPCLSVSPVLVKKRHRENTNNTAGHSEAHL